MSINRLLHIMLIICMVWTINLHPAYAEEQEELKPYSKMEIKHEAADGFASAVRKSREQKEKKRKELQRKKRSPKWISLGDCRITTYCSSCNDPAGYQTSSGKRLREGYVACRWLSNGTRLKINGQEYVVMDYCGTEAIDIFVDTPYCQCNQNYYTEVYIWQKK